MRRRRSVRPMVALFAAFLALAFAASCGTIGVTNDGSSQGANGDGAADARESPTKGSGSGDTIKIGWIPWDEDIVVSHLWKHALEEKGYTVQLVQLDVGPLFAGLAQGDIDLFLDGWLPVTHQTYWEKYGDQLEDLGVWYDNAKLALTVPDYVKDVQSIADLKGRADQFGGRIIGIEAGAGITRVTEQDAMPSYGLTGEYQLAKSSTQAMLAELRRAVRAKEPVVVTLWRPHWAYASMPLRDLEDPKGEMGDVEKIHAIGRSGFAEDFPELAGWLENFTMDDTTLAELEDVALNQHEDDPAAGVRAWMDDNPDVVTELTSASS